MKRTVSDRKTNYFFPFLFHNVESTELHACFVIFVHIEEIVFLRAEIHILHLILSCQS